MAEREGAVRIASVAKVAREFEFLKDRVLAVLIFGSAVSDESARDTDICIVAPEGFDIKEVFRQVDVAGRKYDVWLFEELPLYMKMEVIKGMRSCFAKTFSNSTSISTTSENCGKTRKGEMK